MLNISKEFAPPFKLVVPFFITGTIFYLLSTIALLFYHTTFNYQEFAIAGWVHLFLLGFIIMIIFGAMAQLVPVILETGHFGVDWFYIIFPLLLIGTVLLILGFWINPILLSFGGILVLSAMIIFSTDVFLTIRKTTVKSFTVKSSLVSNIFLIFGILIGFLMALTFSGIVSVNIIDALRIHVFVVVGGYVMITIMGVSLILLPMFGLAHGFKEEPAYIALYLMISSIVCVFIGSLFEINIVNQIGYILALASVSCYYYQVYLIYKVMIRKEFDIWFKSILFGYFCLAMFVILGFVRILNPTLDNFLHGAVWFLFVGFFAFLINGHLYKIIPFLVWFHRYSGLVGKKKVPMLHEMVPKKMAEYEFWFSALGTMLIGISLLLENNLIFRVGSGFMILGALFLVSSVIWMLRFGRGQNG